MNCQRTVIRTSPRICRAHARIYARTLAGALTWSLGVVVLLWFAGDAAFSGWPLLTTMLVLSGLLVPFLAIVLKQEAGVHLNLPPLAWRLHARRRPSVWNEVYVSEYDPALGRDVYRTQFRCPGCEKLGELPTSRTLYRCGEVEYEYRAGWLDDELWSAPSAARQAGSEDPHPTGPHAARMPRADTPVRGSRSVSQLKRDDRSAAWPESSQAVSRVEAAFAPSPYMLENMRTALGDDAPCEKVVRDRDGSGTAALHVPFACIDRAPDELARESAQAEACPEDRRHDAFATSSATFDVPDRASAYDDSGSSASESSGGGDFGGAGASGDY
jgi:uncharacterized membrane protein YgcG